MSHITLPRLFMRSCCRRPEDRTAPSVPRLLLFYVIPLSLLPLLSYVHSQLVHPGVVLPQLDHLPGLAETILLGAAFFMAELLAVALMAMIIQQMGEPVGVIPDYADAYALAATAPTPLWLTTLGLLVPSLWLNLALLPVAWLACIGLIRRGVQALFMPYDDSRTHLLANTLSLVGAAIWLALLLFLALLLSLTVGWR